MAEATVTKLPAQPERIAVAFQLGKDGVQIDGATVKPLSLPAFVDCVLDTRTMNTPNTFEAKLRRNRLMKQVTLYAANTPVPFTAADLSLMPIAVARTLIDKLDTADGPAGKIVRKGDGISEAIVYELGTPIPVGQGKPPIRELEFLAQTFGDVEDIMSAQTGLQQALLLVTTIAKPLGGNLQQLPSWAVNQVTATDGLAISNDVLPFFLGSPDES
jgi:hypothetical protein